MTNDAKSSMSEAAVDHTASGGDRQGRALPYGKMRFSIPETDDEGQRDVEATDVAVVKTTDRSSNSCSPDRYGLISHDP